MALPRVTLVGNSLGGMLALRLALADPGRVSALGLIDSAGLGRGVGLPLRLMTLPGLGELLVAWHRTTLGAWQWVFSLTLQLFAAPWRAPWAWLRQVYCMARSPGYLEATVAAARGELTIRGQRREVILREQLGRLTMPTLVIWGKRDRVLPLRHAWAAVARLPQGTLAIIPGAGHLAHVEQPKKVAAALSHFLAAHG